MEGLAIGNTVFTMGRMAGSSVQVLVSVCRFCATVCDQFATITNYSSVEKHYRFPEPHSSELDGGMIRIYFMNTFQQVLFSLFPTSKKVINVSPPDNWFCLGPIL